MNKTPKEQHIEVTEKGSLGLLAYGDIGIRAWRQVKKETKQQNKNEKKT